VDYCEGCFLKESEHDWRHDFSGQLVQVPLIIEPRIGAFKELIMDSVDYDNYRTGFMPVSIISSAPNEDHYVVGGYIGDDLMQWSVSSSNLVLPRGPEFTKVFSAMENVEVVDAQGIWWGATIVFSLNANNEYSIIWKASFDGFSKIETVHKRRVRSATKVSSDEHGKKRSREICVNQLTADTKKKQSLLK
jgi:hypothetical protein